MSVPACIKKLIYKKMFVQRYEQNTAKSRSLQIYTQSNFDTSH